jgi:hypothetical protein
MSDQKTKPSSPTDQVLNRRRVLKVAMATAPVIATLPSGAALARSSNLIGTATNARDAKNRTLCLDVRSGTGNVVNGVLDLGVPPRGSLTAINERDYKVDDRWGASSVSESQMCKQGGTYYYWNSGWRQARIPKGITVSATALSSFAGSIYTTEV